MKILTFQCTVLPIIAASGKIKIENAIKALPVSCLQQLLPEKEARKANHLNFVVLMFT